jgi:hypothetical protein
VIRSAVAIKSWIVQIPSVDELRPACCVECGAASQPVGGPMVVHGHGLLHRQVRGVLTVDGAPGIAVVAVRRYECQSCGAVMTVVPAELLARRQYSAPSIALALHLWLVLGWSDRRVRERVCAWPVRGRSARGWAQLYRWTRSAATLFRLPRAVDMRDRAYDIARRVLLALRSLAPSALSVAPIEAQVFEGAARALR